MTRVKDILKKNTMFVALIAALVLFQILIVSEGKGSMFAPTNITNLISQNSYVVILATGMLLCILSGGNIDLSVGSAVALIGAISGTLIVNMHLNVVLSIIICLIVGILIGMWQGFWIAYMKIPSFIVTLADMLLWRGIALLILNGLTIAPFPESYLKYFTGFVPNTKDKPTIFLITMIIGVLISLIVVIAEIVGYMRKKKNGYHCENAGLKFSIMSITCIVILWLSFLLGNDKGLPIVLIIISITVFVYSYLTNRTVPGRHLYALGGNEKAATLSGINTKKILFLAYTNMSFLAAVAALVCTARFNSASPSAGTNYELDAIGACFIGGASAYGGVGTVKGAVVGAIFMGVLNNGMSILGIDANWQKVVKGVVLLAAVAIDVIGKKRAKN